VYRSHQSCIKEVEESLDCFGTYPQILRVASWGNRRFFSWGKDTHIDQPFQSELDILHYGFSIHQ